MYAMDPGIEVLNERTGQTGRAVEYSYSTMFAYRCLKCPDVVLVEVNGLPETWPLLHCRPMQATYDPPVA